MQQESLFAATAVAAVTVPTLLGGALAVWVVRRVESSAGARYRDGYAEGYVDGVTDRRPAPERTLSLVPGHQIGHQARSR